jgi:hypothetical protein
MRNNASLPLTPVTSNENDGAMPLDPPTTSPDNPSDASDSPCDINIPLIQLVFPRHAAWICETSFPLHIVTPPSHVLDGFVADPRPSSAPSSLVDAGPFGTGIESRIALIRLPPPHHTSARPERLNANFSDILRAHDSTRLANSSAFGSAASRLHGALDIKESLTALLDLAGECLEAEHLVLILDKQERGEGEMRALLHSLLYAGGVVLPPTQGQGNGVLGGWEWDHERWVLVGLEL